MKEKDEAADVYKVQMFVKGTEEDAASLRKSLAQTVFDGFDMTRQNAVFGVAVDLDIPPAHEYVMALCMVKLEEGFNIRQINKLVSMLPEDGEYMPIEFHAQNTSAYGFIAADYYEAHDYDNTFFKSLYEVLEDMDKETPDGIYATPDDRIFYMGYLNDTGCVK